jgi:hydroxypyruvate isomerase
MRMLKIVKSFGYTGYIGVEYEGERLSEIEGIKATRDLLIKVGQSI